MWTLCTGKKLILRKHRELKYKGGISMEKFDIFKSECGAVAEVLYKENKECVCSAETKFEKLEEHTEDAAKEKHVPFIEEKENGYLVKVGKETAHPMLDAHYIVMIEILVDGDKLYRKYLKPGDAPEAFFEVPKGETVKAREYCNLHGLWVSVK